jgi:alpha-methylacyl-CoA racemase
VLARGTPHPAPAPRFSRTPGAITRPAAKPGENTEEILREIGSLSWRQAEGGAGSRGRKVSW